MRNYPKIGDAVKIKETGEIHIVKELWKPGRIMLDDGSIFYLGGIEPIGELIKCAGCGELFPIDEMTEIDDGLYSHSKGCSDFYYSMEDL